MFEVSIYDDVSSQIFEKIMYNVMYILKDNVALE